VLGAADSPDDRPASGQIDKVLPEGPLLILLDELVMYQRTLTEQGKGNLLAFLGLLLKKVANRPQTVLVVTDPGSQQVYATESERLGQALDAGGRDAGDLDELLDRTTSDFDPIGREAPQVIARRLFERVDANAASSAAATYQSLYTRVLEEHPGLLPPNAAHSDYAKRIADCYPFHPRLFDTAQNRLGALQDFQKSRGVLRLFARIIRDVWETGADIELVTAGDINWSSPRIQADLLHRIKRDNFVSAIGADIEGHAAELDGGPTGPHRRAASALLLESIELTPSSGLNEAELTLAALRPDEAGPEPAEAAGRLSSVCWHTYPLASGSGWQFRYEPNVIKQIEERISRIPREDARSLVLTEIQSYFSGPAFKMANWPQTARQVPDAAELQLVLCDSEALATTVTRYCDDSDPAAPQPRQFQNAIVAIAPTAPALNDAVRRAQRVMAAQAVYEENKTGDANKLTRDQVTRLLPDYRRQFKLQARRAFDRVVTAGSAYGMEEQYQTDEQVLQHASGQTCLRTFLDQKGLIYQPNDALDSGLFVEKILPGATPLASQPDAKTTRAVHERILGAPNLRLVSNNSLTRMTIERAVRDNKVVVRLADGRAFDADGCVQGPDGQRRRSAGQQLSGTPIDESTLVAQTEHASAQLWLRIDDIQSGAGGSGSSGGTLPPPPPPPVGPVSASTWPDIVNFAEKRPLVKLTLAAKAPAAADMLLVLGQPLGADQLALSVDLSGDLKDGGFLAFAVQDVKPGHPTEPLQTARSFYRALADGATFEASLVLHFGQGRDGMDGVLSQLAEKASETVSVKAEFAAPSGGAT